MLYACFVQAWTSKTMQEPTPAHYALLDPLRGLASLLVVLHHLPGQPLGRWAGEPGVMLFFVISGYCIAAAWHRMTQREQESPWKSVGTFMFRRVRRIFPPWWAALALWVVFAGFERAMSIDGGTWALNASLLHWVHLIAHPTTSGSASGNPIAIMGIAWTLCYEEQYYAIMALLLLTSLLLSRAGAVWARKACGIVLALLVVVGLVWVSLHPHHATGIILDYLPHFGVGLALYLVLCVLRGRARVAGMAFMLACAGAATIVHLKAFPDVPFFADSVRRTKHVSRELVIATWSGVLLLALRGADGAWVRMLQASRERAKNSLARVARSWLVRSVQFLGAMSYSLYLTHTIPAHAVEAVGEKVFGNAASDTKVIIMIAAQLITQLALAAAFWWAVERHFVGGSKKTK